MLKRKKPLVQINTASASHSVNESSLKSGSKSTEQDDHGIRTFHVLYRKPQNKKHKSWDGDGTMEVDVGSGNWKLISEQGKQIGTGQGLSEQVLQGSQTFTIAGKECEVQSEIGSSKSKAAPSSSITPKSIPSTSTNVPLKAKVADSSVIYKGFMRKPQNKMHKTWDSDMFLKVDGSSWILLGENGEEIGKAQKPSVSIPAIGVEFKICGKELELASGPLTSAEYQKQIYTGGSRESVQVAPKPMPLNPFKPFKSIISSKSKHALQPKFDPTKANSLLMPMTDKDSVQVVVDPFISGKLKPFQRDGVVFLYECMMGHKAQDHQGAILADEMGLGKSLQTITLVWTLLKQSPQSRLPTAKKCLIVAPASLLNNWAKEFKKWLGDTRVKTYIVKNDSVSADFLAFHQVLIINYEKVKKFKNELVKGNYDIIVCDEGHRLKNASNQAFQILQDLKCKRRIILTGTPLQNDLLEFFQMIDFVNPGLLGTLSQFKKYFANPIDSSRTSDSLDSVNEKGRAKLDELLSFVSPYMLRRLGTENEKFLPPKQKFIVFTRLSESQADHYKAVIDEESSDALSKITKLRQICNCDDAVFEKSSKFVAVGELLKEIKGLNEKVVIVSHWTKNLDEFEGFLKQQEWQFKRLDGSVGAAKRQPLVDEFNMNDSLFAFLLSSKAGGAGLNLIGASRLIMLDIDWNPAIDYQAMARIWRHGQKLPVFIYRFIASGTIEEHIYQRQGFKKQLSDSVMEHTDSETVKFSAEELKMIMTYHPLIDSLTHRTMCKNDCSVKEHLSRPFGAILEDQFDDVALSAIVERVESISFVLAGEKDNAD